MIKEDTPTVKRLDEEVNMKGSRSGLPEHQTFLSYGKTFVKTNTYAVPTSQTLITVAHGLLWNRYPN